MKARLISILTAIAILIGLCGCQDAVPTETADAVAETNYYAHWLDGATELSSLVDAVITGTGVFSICDGRKIIQTDIAGTKISEFSVPLTETQSLSGLCITQDGSLALLRVTSGDDINTELELLIADQGGSLLSARTLPIYALPVDIVSDEKDGYLIACDNDMLYELDANLEIKEETYVESLSQLLSQDNTLYVIQVTPETTNANATTIISTWAEADINPLSHLDGAYTGFMTLDGCICLTDNQGLYSFDETTGTAIELLTWENVGLDHAMQIPVAAVSLQEFLFTSVTLSDVDLFQLNTVPPEPDDHTVTLTLAYWALTAAEQMAIQTFNRSQNAYQIELRCYYPEDGDITAALTRMNADLLTGEAPDLYALNGMDVDQLQNAGLLMDLNPLMDSDPGFSKEDYYENIWALFEVGGCLYEFVPSFSLAGLAGTQDLLGDRTGWTIEEFDTFAGQNQDTFPIAFISSLDFLYGCIRYGNHDFLNTSNYTCAFDTEEMEALMKLCSLLPEVGNQEGLLREYWMSGLWAYQQMLEEVGRELRFVGYPASSATGPAVNAFYTYAISSTTECPDGAWAFLKFLLRDNQQNLCLSDGFPVKKSVLHEAFQRAMLPNSDPNALFYGYESAPMSLSEIEYVENLILGASQRYCRYKQILNIVEEESAAYFCGDKSAYEVCKVIQNRVSIYLGEQKP